MKNKLVITLLVIALVLALVCAGTAGYMWYRNNHVFVGEDAYRIDSTLLDLRAQEISEDYYLELQKQLPNCEILWNVPFQGSMLSSDTGKITVSDITEAEITVLKAYFPKLQTVDASACGNYGMLEALKAQLPEVDVLYTVDVGGKSFAPDTAELTLAEGEYDLAVLTENLKHLSLVSAIALPKTELTPEQLDALQAAFPEISLSYTVEILGQEYAPDAQQLDLSAAVSEDVEMLSRKLLMLPQVTSIELTDASGASHLTKEDVKALMAAAPDAAFRYTFDFYGLTLCTDMEEVHIKNKAIGDEGEAEVRLVLDLMKSCKRFVLEGCRLSNEVLAGIREDYREQTKLVWRVSFGDGSCLTDAEIIRCTYDLVDSNCHDLIYCEDVRYMDIGHNEQLYTVDFVAGMPNLEVIIVSGAPIKDLTPFQNCKNLRVLEIAFCGYVDDISPLAACEKLEMLNIAYTKVKDLSALDDKNMTHLCAMRPRAMIPAAEQQRFNELHPDCWSTYVGEQPYGAGWRYDKKNIALPWYANIREVFKYPHAPNNAGWYLS